MFHENTYCDYYMCRILKKIKVLHRKNNFNINHNFEIRYLCNEPLLTDVKIMK